ncbi:MAG: 3-deoxy-7-phosphoheptulonate synthase, partial [Lachnospiraceae bacterium]|nr:3-deoxy-7-phosphoheptulonate synthase [Lachnospiraceae bacterium]
NEEAVLDYILRLKKVQEKVEDKILLIPRVYTNKPRTTGKGYKGMLHQPDPEKKPDMLAGLIAIRKMHIDIMNQTEMMPADEMLYPENHWYMDDVLSYVAVGARSVEDQQHRLVASGINVPVGMKNPTSGDFNVMLNSITAAQAKQTFIYRRWEVETSGNPLAHAILRGAVNKHGNTIPNYHYEDLLLLADMYGKQELENPSIIIDCNHSNSGKKYMEQIRIAKSVLHSMSYNSDINRMVKGLMIESYIEPGTQKIGEGVYGKSITDPCLGWDDSEKLIYDIAEMLK